MECPICAETTKTSIQCEYCEFNACRTCCQTYLLNEPMPKCMSAGCNREWTRRFINASFPKTFVAKQLKKHREDVLFERERSMLPATQPLIEAQIIRENNNRFYKEMFNEQREINTRYENMFKNLKRQQQEELQHLRNKYDVLIIPATTATETRKTFIRACPEEECRGFLSSQWKCGVCEKYTCPDCHVVKAGRDDPNHTCKVEDVATAKLISSDTKACPKCATGIFKVSGCDLMWCTQCHTNFNWNTGRVQTGNNHNPHYFEWLRRTGGGNAPPAAGAVLCGREIDHHFNSSIISLLHSCKVDQQFGDKITAITRSVVHINEVEVPRYNTDRFRNNENTRIKYMRNQITEAKFKQLIQMASKKHDKYAEIQNALQLYVATATEILYRFKDHLEAVPLATKAVYKRGKIITPETTPTTSPEVVAKRHSVLAEIDALTKYVNECLQQTSANFSSVLLQLNLEHDSVLVNATPKKTTVPPLP